MEAIRSFETSVPVYNSTRNNIQEDLNFHRHHCEKSQYGISLLQPCRYSLAVAPIPSDSCNTANSFPSWKLKAGRLSWEAFWLLDPLSLGQEMTPQRLLTVEGGGQCFNPCPSLGSGGILTPFTLATKERMMVKVKQKGGWRGEMLTWNMRIALSYREFSSSHYPASFWEHQQTLKPVGGGSLTSFPKCSDWDSLAWKLKKKK